MGYHSTEDVTIADASLQTASDGIVVSGRATNDSEAPLIVDLEVTFLKNGTEMFQRTLAPLRRGREKSAIRQAVRCAGSQPGSL